MGQLLDKEVGGMKMKIGIIISNTDPELVWNALRFANTATLEGHYVKIFLLGAGVEIENIKSEKFNVEEQLQKFNELSGTMLACGTCIKSRQMQFAICPISTMKDMLKIVEESDKVLTF
ncbi:MAG: DsrE family protein [Thermoproteota archaeon]|nr:DsrE family protein [Thermoproteota archaeon]